MLLFMGQALECNASLHHVIKSIRAMQVFTLPHRLLILALDIVDVGFRLPLWAREREREPLSVNIELGKHYIVSGSGSDCPVVSLWWPKNHYTTVTC